MNRTDLVRALRQDGYADPDGAVQRVLDVIAKSLACGEPITIRGFGRFETRVQAAVVRRNPRTGEAVKVPEKVAIGFVPSRALKARVNKSA